MLPATAPIRALPPYRRDPITWVAFVELLSFGVLNAGLGAALPFLRDAEHISYLAGALHQVAFAIGGGLAGILTARARRMPGRPWTIRGGLLGAAIAWLGVGYGDVLAITAGAAFLVSLLATAALIRLWAVLADAYGPHRAVAVTMVSGLYGANLRPGAGQPARPPVSRRAIARRRARCGAARAADPADSAERVHGRTRPGHRRGGHRGDIPAHVGDARRDEPARCRRRHGPSARYRISRPNVWPAGCRRARPGIELAGRTDRLGGVHAPGRGRIALQVSRTN